jgi:hypothetical protein
MIKPNFFIVGAPKCGTTSLATWLAEHPQIYMSPVKEPHHFNTDHKHVMTPSRRDYERLFENANDSHLAVGEASVWYMYSKEAIPNVERYTSNSKYIVCLRNPVEMAYSLHEQLFVAGYESEPDFVAAWHLQHDRVNGKSIPSLCREPRYLEYGPACSLGEQLRRVYAYVPKERVLTILLDDVKLDPRAEYLRILRFLNAEDDGRSNFPVINSAKVLRSKVLLKSIRLLGDLKRSLGMQYGFGILNAINQKNIHYRVRASMPVAMVKVLEDYFREDVRKLERLIGRDLSHWL